jgi:arginyl-tRNA synthetase
MACSRTPSAKNKIPAPSPKTRRRARRHHTWNATTSPSPGPGFINFSLKPAALLEWLQAFASRDALKAGAATAYAGKTWVVDYSSPNTAKQMHVGHLPSIIVGESISRLLEFSGAKVIRDNHLGDWGTQFGKSSTATNTWADREALARDPLEEFERLYKAANAPAARDPAALEATRLELVRLQRGDADAIAIWETVNRVSIEALQTIYQQLGVRYDHFLGESFTAIASPRSIAN